MHSVGAERQLASIFHCFPKLPKELRRRIWQFCLPLPRVEELDFPVATYAYNSKSGKLEDCPCRLWTSSMLNTHMPVISRVCFEAREVVLEAARPFPQSGVPIPTEVLDVLTNNSRDFWWGRERASLHLNWHGGYEHEFGVAWGAADGDGTKPLRCLEQQLSQSGSGQVGAFSLGYLDDDYGNTIPDISVPYLRETQSRRRHSFIEESETDEWISILSCRSKWHVVMRIVVIHAPRSVHTTGLFGILGDAPIQIVDIRDQEKIHAMYDLAEACEKRSTIEVKTPQSFYRSSVQEMETFLQDSVIDIFGKAEWPFELRPTVMFRWCPLMCNHPGEMLNDMKWPVREDRL